MSTKKMERWKEGLIADQDVCAKVVFRSWRNKFLLLLLCRRRCPSLIVYNVIFFPILASLFCATSSPFLRLSRPLVRRIAGTPEMAEVIFRRRDERTDGTTNGTDSAAAST